MTRDPGFSCSHDNDRNPCPSQLSHDQRVRSTKQQQAEIRAGVLAGRIGPDFLQVPKDVIVSSFVEGHGLARVEVHFRVEADITTDGKVDPEKRQALERSVERAMREVVIEIGGANAGR